MILTLLGAFLVSTHDCSQIQEIENNCDTENNFLEEIGKTFAIEMNESDWSNFNLMAESDVLVMRNGNLDFYDGIFQSKITGNGKTYQHFEEVDISFYYQMPQSDWSNIGSIHQSEYGIHRLK